MLKDEFCTPEGSRCVILRGAPGGLGFEARGGEVGDDGWPLRLVWQHSLKSVLYRSYHPPLLDVALIEGLLIAAGIGKVLGVGGSKIVGTREVLLGTHIQVVVLGGM